MVRLPQHCPRRLLASRGDIADCAGDDGNRGGEVRSCNRPGRPPEIAPASQRLGPERRPSTPSGAPLRIRSAAPDAGSRVAAHSAG